jgi:hypothetical protein
VILILRLNSLSHGSLGRSTQLPSTSNFQPVIDAAQAAFLVAAEEQRGGTVRTALVDEADAALRVAEGDQLLAQQLHPHRRTIRRGKLIAEQRRNPITPHELPHRRAGTGPRQQLIVFAR